MKWVLTTVSSGFCSFGLVIFNPGQSFTPQYDKASSEMFDGSWRRIVDVMIEPVIPPANCKKVVNDERNKKRSSPADHAEPG